MNPSIYKTAASAARTSWMSKVFGGLGRAVGKLNLPLTLVLIASDIWSAVSANSSDGSDTVSTLIGAGRQQNFSAILLPPSIVRAITNPISDSEAVSNAFTQACLKASSSSDGLARLRATAYVVASDYLVKAPDVDIFIYSPDKTEELLDELDDVFKDDAIQLNTDGVDDLQLDAEDIASAPPDVRRILDFTAHFVFHMLQEAEES